MNTTRQKMSKIIDELFTFFFSVGSEEVSMNVKKCADGYELTMDSGYCPREYKRVADLNRFLNAEEKNEGLEETFWELAGVSGLGQDSELHLIGQMVDRAEVRIENGRVFLTLFKKND